MKCGTSNLTSRLFNHFPQWVCNRQNENFPTSVTLKRAAPVSSGTDQDWATSAQRPRLPVARNQGGGLLNQFPLSTISLMFQNYQNVAYLLNITFIVDRCRRSRAAVTPVEYERGWRIKDVNLPKNITDGAINDQIFNNNYRLASGSLVIRPHCHMDFRVQPEMLLYY